MLLIIYTDEYEKREMGMILLASAVNNKVRLMTQNKLMIRENTLKQLDLPRETVTISSYYLCISNI